MANDPAITQQVTQAIAPSGFVRNAQSDESGRILMVPASSAPLNVSVAASTVNALSSSTSQIGSIANTSFTVGGNVDVGSINNIVFVTYSTQPTITVTSANTQSVALTSGTQTIGTVISSPSTAPISLTTTNVIGLTTTSLVTLTSGTATLGAITNTSFTVAGAISFTSIPTVDLTTTEIIALASGASQIGTIGNTSFTISGAITNTSFTIAGAITNTSFTVGGTVGLTSGSAVPISTTASVTTAALTSSTTPQLVVAANGSRKGLYITGGTSPAYIFLGSTTTAVSTAFGGYSIQLTTSPNFRDFGSASAIWAGAIMGVAGLLTGSTLTITELT